MQVGAVGQGLELRDEAGFLAFAMEGEAGRFGGDDEVRVAGVEQPRGRIGVRGVQIASATPAPCACWSAQ